MPKFNKHIVKKITALIRSDNYTISELCRLSAISESTYYKWKNDHSEFSEALLRARWHYDDKLVVAATRSLMKLVEGFYVTEEKLIYGKRSALDKNEHQIPKTRIVSTRYIHPSLGAIIFVLTNKDPEHWKNTFRTEVTGEGAKSLIPARVLTQREAREYMSKLTDAELDQRIIELDLSSISKVKKIEKPK